MILRDDEFSVLKDKIRQLGDTTLNTAAANDYVPEMERAIRVIKERNRAAVNTLPLPITESY